jgi:Cysteine-rich CWC
MKETGDKIICAACNQPFICRAGNIQQCECSTVVLPAAAREWIAEHYDGCICINCLKAIQQRFLAENA